MMKVKYQEVMCCAEYAPAQCCWCILCILIKVVYFNLPLSESNRKTIFLSLLVTSILGTLSFLALRKGHREEEMLSEEEGQSLLSTRMM